MKRFIFASLLSLVLIGQAFAQSQGPSGATTGPSSSSGAGIAVVVSSAAESNHVMKASAGNFYGGYITTGASAGYLMMFNLTSAPTDGAVTPAACIYVPATTSMSLTGIATIPIYWSTGIVMVFSTTGCFTKTASATAYFSGMVQ